MHPSKKKSFQANRCPWVDLTKVDYVAYHDREWGVPVYDDRKLFEFLILDDKSTDGSIDYLSSINDNRIKLIKNENNIFWILIPIFLGFAFLSKQVPTVYVIMSQGASLLNNLFKMKEMNVNKINIISSGGSYKEIRRLGYNCIEVSKYTKFSEMLDGRVKTLHPKIHAGILSNRSNKKHRREMKKKKFNYIDLIVVNFYPFEKNN